MNELCFTAIVLNLNKFITIVYMQVYPQIPVDSVTFTEEILYGKLHFLYTEK